MQAHGRAAIADHTPRGFALTRRHCTSPEMPVTTRSRAGSSVVEHLTFNQMVVG
jgi:hypothetical protein